MKLLRSPLAWLLLALVGTVAAPFAFSTDGGSVDEPLPEYGLPTTTPPPPINDELVALVREHADSCTVSVERSEVWACRAGLMRDTATYVAEKKPSDFASTLLAVARGLAGGPGLSAAAIAVFADHFERLGDDAKRQNATPAVVAVALALWSNLSDASAIRLAKPFAELAVLAGELDALLDAAARHRTPAAGAAARRSVARYGGVPAFERVRAIAEGPGGNPCDALVVARTLNLADATVRTEVCGWGKQYLRDAAAETCAATLMDQCDGAYVTTLLDEAERRLATRAADGKSAYRDPFAHAMRGLGVGEATQRRRVRAFLVKVARDSTVLDDVRANALRALPEQFYDMETYEVLQALAKHGDAPVSRGAFDALQTMEGDRKEQWAHRYAEAHARGATRAGP